MQQNNKTPKTAVIMPAYNSGATIEASVRSILNQTVSNLVLIVVNDGSTDDTAAVLEKLRAEDERLIPMTVPNGGPAKARNLALDAVPEDAEYIMFADSDDLLESDALEYALTEGRGADLVLMGFSIKNTDGSTAAAVADRQPVYLQAQTVTITILPDITVDVPRPRDCESL